MAGHPGDSDPSGRLRAPIPDLELVAERRDTLKLLSTLKAYKKGKFGECGKTGKSRRDGGENMKIIQKGHI